MDALDFIAKEHKRIERAFAKLAGTPAENVEVRERMFRSIKSDLEIHMRIEESILYPLLKKQSEVRGKSFAGNAEHDFGKTLLREMNSIPANDEEWVAKLSMLRKKIEHHNKEEQEDLFPEARKVLSQDEIDDLGRRLLTARENLNETILQP